MPYTVPMHLGTLARTLLRYMVPGFLTFLIDLGLLQAFIVYLNWHYLPAAIVAFWGGTSVNYVVARRWVFAGATRPLLSGYAYFMTFAAAGTGLTAMFMAIFVELAGFAPLPARVATAAIVGLWNFLTNFYINFRMHERFSLPTIDK